MLSANKILVLFLSLRVLAAGPALVQESYLISSHVSMLHLSFEVFRVPNKITLNKVCNR